MASIKLTFGLMCCALTLCIIYFRPQTPVDDSRPSLLRKERAAEKDNCLWVLIAGESVRTLTSPNYPDFYPSHAHCQWLLTTLDPNATLSIRIDTLVIEPDAECRLDYLRVFLGSSERAPSLGPFCGNVNNRIIDTNSSTLLLVFHSDLMYEDKGFLIDYFTPTAKSCKELLTDASDTLTSPGYPDHYPDDTDCWTVITVGEGEKILLHFETVDLEYGEKCTFDHIRIFDGKDKNSVLLGQICHHSGPLSFESSSNSLLVHFHSDSSVSKRGYRARYSSVDQRSKLVGNCLWDKNNATITSPHYPEKYPSLTNCSIWIVAPEDSKILITFDAVHLEMDSNCSYDYLRITQGPQFSSRYCGRRTERRSLMSTDNEIRIEFQSDGFVEFQGFKLRYEFIQEEPEEELDVWRAKPENATLAAGATHMLHCDTERPDARIRWLKEDMFLAGDAPLPGLQLLENNTLWIRSMQRHLVGQYTCIAVSPEEEIMATADLSMKDESNHCGIEFRKIPSNLELKEGDFAHLECQSTLPGVQVSWEKEGQALEPNQHVTILKNGYIFVDQVTLEDTGLYSCVVRHAQSGCIQRVSATLTIAEKSNIEDVCGRSQFEETEEEKASSAHAKIVGGRNAPKGAYPWQVMLCEGKRQSFCGATLLNERWIATAAHCITNNKHNIPWDRITIKLGKHDTQRDEEQEEHTTIADFSTVLIHPLFNNMTLDNDLALIRLRHRIRFKDYILPICLPDRNLSETLLNGDTSDLKMGVVIGWGKLTENGPLPRYLQEIKLPVMDDQVCRTSTHYFVTRNMFCAGYSQEVIGDSCHGDSGGPFMMKHQGRWYLIGIVSWGEGCGQTNKYGFYTRIANYLPWIQGIIKS